MLSFQRVLPSEPGSNQVTCPVTGTCYVSGPISPEAEDVLDKLFSDALAKRTDLKVVPSSLSEKAMRQAGGRQLVIDRRQEIMEVGQRLRVDAVMVPFVYRYTERVGGAAAAEKPATVTFDVSMIRSSDGKVIWKNSFDETQKPLSDNILNIDQYMKHGFRWFTAEQLSEIGVDQIMNRFPWAKPQAQAPAAE